MIGTGGRALAGPFRVLATASMRVARKHGNPTCDVLLPFGHPPSGTYTVAGSLPPSFVHPRRPRRFGAVGALLLFPLAGDALAAQTKGRTLFALHGGALDSARRLRCTRGGIRMSDPDLLIVMKAMNAAQAAGDPLRTIEVIEIPDADVGSIPPMDLRGARRLLGESPDGRLPGSDTSTHAMFLFALGMGAGGLEGGARAATAATREASGDRAGKAGLDRRAFIQSALLLVGGLTTGACSQAASSNCETYCPPHPHNDGGRGDGGPESCDASQMVTNCSPDNSGYVVAGGVG